MITKYTIKKITYKKAIPKDFTPKSRTTFIDLIKIIFAYISQRN